MAAGLTGAATVVLQLLWVEMLAKTAAGAALVLFPRSLARLLGLPPVAEAFWPRLLGALLLGLAAATFAEGQLSASNGLGLAGHVAINLLLALALTGMLIMGKAGVTLRGRIFVGLLVGALAVLALVELAYA